MNFIQESAIDPSHKSHNASDKYPTMHHFATEMCTFQLQNGASWDIYDALWDLWDRSIENVVCCMSNILSGPQCYKRPNCSWSLYSTLSLRAFLLKNALQDSQEMASKLHPRATSPQMLQTFRSFFASFRFRLPEELSPLPSSPPVSGGEFCGKKEESLIKQFHNNH